jgi:hypothetical protein
MSLIQILSYNDTKHDFRDIKTNKFYESWVKAHAVGSFTRESDIEDEILKHIGMYEFPVLQSINSRISQNSYEITLPTEDLAGEPFKIWLGTVIHDSLKDINFMTDVNAINQSVLCDVKMKGSRSKGRILFDGTTLYDRGTNVVESDNCVTNSADPGLNIVAKKNENVFMLENVTINGIEMRYSFKFGKKTIENVINLRDYVAKYTSQTNRKLTLYKKILEALADDSGAGGEQKGKKRKRDVLGDLLDVLHEIYNIDRGFLSSVHTSGEARTILAGMLFDLKRIGDQLQIISCKIRKNSVFITNDRMSFALCRALDVHAIRTVSLHSPSRRRLCFYNLPVDTAKFEQSMKTEIRHAVRAMYDRLTDYVRGIQIIQADLSANSKDFEAALALYRKLANPIINHSVHRSIHNIYIYECMVEWSFIMYYFSVADVLRSTDVSDRNVEHIRALYAELDSDAVSVARAQDILKAFSEFFHTNLILPSFDAATFISQIMHVLRVGGDFNTLLANANGISAAEDIRGFLKHFEGKTPQRVSVIVPGFNSELNTRILLCTRNNKKAYEEKVRLYTELVETKALSKDDLQIDGGGGATIGAPVTKGTASRSHFKATTAMAPPPQRSATAHLPASIRQERMVTQTRMRTPQKLITTKSIKSPTTGMYSLYSDPHKLQEVQDSDIHKIFSVIKPDVDRENWDIIQVIVSFLCKTDDMFLECLLGFYS